MLMFVTSVIQACQKAGIEEKFFNVLGRHSLTLEKHHSASLHSFCYSTLCVSAVFAVAWCLSVCHIGALYPHGWRYHQISLSAR